MWKLFYIYDKANPLVRFIILLVLGLFWVAIMLIGLSFGSNWLIAFIIAFPVLFFLFRNGYDNHINYDGRYEKKMISNR